MEKQKTTAVRIEVKATIPFMFDPYAYEDAVHFYQEYANATWKKTMTVIPSSAESPNNNKEGFIGHTPKDLFLFGKKSTNLVDFLVETFYLLFSCHFL